MRYKNKIDLWIKIMLFVVTFMFIPMLPFVAKDEIVVLLISTAVMMIIILPMFFGYVELGDEEITVRLSVFRQKIKYENIKSIRMCTNFLSSMAMTKDRIEIRVHNRGYVRGTTFIGPVDREAFFKELERRCYNLERNDTIE